MTATAHIARRTTRNKPQRTLRDRWNAFQLRHSRTVQAQFFQGLHDALPLDDPDRHALDAPAIEDAFVRLAADHPMTVTPTDGGTAARDADREQLLLALCDRWFHEANPAPEHRWSPETVAAYARLLGDVHACFQQPGGDA